MRRVRRVVAAVAMVTAVVGTASGVAHGATVGPDDKGWWSKAQAAPAPAPTVPVGTATGSNAMVGNDPTGPNAIAAVRYTVPGTLDGEPINASTASGTLTLKVPANGAVGTPVVFACPIISSWQTAEGGTWEARPKYTCATKAAGTFNADTTAVTFSLPPNLQARPGVFDLAIVPDPANQTPFSVQFEAPGGDSLAVRAAGAPAPADAGTQAPGSAGSASIPAGDSSTGSFAPVFPSQPLPSDGSPATTVGASPATGVGSDGSRTALGVPGSTGGVPAKRGQRIMAAVLLVLLGASLFWFGRQPVRSARLLGSLGADAPADEPHL